MAHVGIESLAARNGQEYGCEDRQRRGDVRAQYVAEGVGGIDCDENLGGGQYAADAEHAQHREPKKHKWPEDPADPTGPHPLSRKQDRQNDERDGNDKRSELRSIEGEPFDGTQDRDCWRDCAVGIEQCRSDKTQDREVQARRSRLNSAHPEERQKGDDAALAAVVGPQDEDAVLDRDDDDQRPQDQGQHPQYRDRAEPATTCRVRGFLQRVERTGPDITKDDSEGAEYGSPGDSPAPQPMGVRVGCGGHEVPVRLASSRCQSGADRV